MNDVFHQLDEMYTELVKKKKKTDSLVIKATMDSLPSIGFFGGQHSLFVVHTFNDICDSTFLSLSVCFISMMYSSSSAMTMKHDDVLVEMLQRLFGFRNLLPIIYGLKLTGTEPFWSLDGSQLEANMVWRPW